MDLRHTNPRRIISYTFLWQLDTCFLLLFPSSSLYFSSAVYFDTRLCTLVRVNRKRKPQFPSAMRPSCRYLLKYPQIFPSDCPSLSGHLHFYDLHTRPPWDRTTVDSLHVVQFSSVCFTGSRYPRQQTRCISLVIAFDWERIFIAFFVLVLIMCSKMFLCDCCGLCVLFVFLFTFFVFALFFVVIFVVDICCCCCLLLRLLSFYSFSRAHLHVLGLLRFTSLTLTNRGCPLLFILFLCIFLWFWPIQLYFIP